MLWGGNSGAMEIRGEGGETRLRAVFPYGRETVLQKAGRGPARHEVIAPRAFARRIESGEDIHLLAAHDFNKPLASRSAGTLTLTDGEDALVVEAILSPELLTVSYARDFLAAHRAGLIRGLSPGFQVADGGERVEMRAGAVLRTVTTADLFELSAVTRPAYPAAQIEARNWKPDEGNTLSGLSHLSRWRL